VRRGPGGQAMMSYQVTPRDVDMMIRGVALLAEIYFAAGARRVVLPVDGMQPIASVDEIRKLFASPIRPADLEVLTVHAMGTARLSDAPEHGACDPTGQIWGHPGVYVADASLFPTSIGVNPQVTVMALATQVAWGVAERLQKKGARE